MKQHKILIVGDNPKIFASIQMGLESSGFIVDNPSKKKFKRNMASGNEYDCIIIDFHLKYINGIELCKQIRMQNQIIPILFITANGTIDDKIKGFDSGADDFMVLPFEFRELLARIKVLFRQRNNDESISKCLKIGDLELNQESKNVTRSGRIINLTAKEFFLLEYLLKNKNRIIPKAEIAQNVWKVNLTSMTNTIEVYINFLRVKIDNKNYSSKFIHTHVGLGYELKEVNKVKVKTRKR